MRKTLEQYIGNEITIITVVKEIEEYNNKSKKEERILLSKIINKENNEFLTDHLWYPKSKFKLIESLSIGDIVEIKGRVSVYLKALYNKNIRNKFNYNIDFDIENIKKIGEQEDDEKKIEFYTEVCQSKVIVDYYFTLHNLKKIYTTLENKDYLYIKFLRDTVKARLLNDPNYESILIINSKGSIYIKNKKYKDKLDLKSNEIILCRIGKKIYGMGKVYGDYAEILENRDIQEHFDIIDRWHDLPNNHKDKIKVVSSNLEYILQPYIDSIETLKRALELEIEYNINNENKNSQLSKDILNKGKCIKDSIIIKTSLVRNRVNKNYCFKEKELEIIYKNLVKKRFNIMMKIFYIVKNHLNNNIEYDHVLVINNQGKIYFIKVDRNNVDINDYLELSEIEICRFGKKVIKKSNIYHDYVEILKKEYDNLEDLDIWSLWYNLDNNDNIKEEIMEKNFQIRKDGYISHYNILLKGIAKEIEKQNMYCRREFNDTIIY